MSLKKDTKEKARREAIAKAQAGDQKLREQVITENMGLVHMVAARFAGRGCEMEDLYQIGTIGLMKAVDRFDTSLSYTFSTYAVPLIMGEIRRFLRDDGLIHVSRQVRENARKIAIVREQMKKSDNKEPTVEGLCRMTGLSCEEIILASQATVEVDSIQRVISAEEGENGVKLEEMIPGEKNFELPIIDKIALEQVLGELKEEESRLICLRYMENKTQSEVAALMGKNQVAVSRMERKILGILRGLLI